MGIGDWGLGIGPNPQSPIPNPQSPIPSPHLNLIIIKFKRNYFKLFKEIKILFDLKELKGIKNYELKIKCIITINKIE